MANVAPAILFNNLNPKIRPIAIKFRWHSKPDEEFIAKEVKRLSLADGIIVESRSPWRAQF